MKKDHHSSPVILFGAWDRHNLGDLLYPHLTARLLAPRPVRVAGIVDRDLTAWGGHRVRALAGLARDWGLDQADAPADVLHPGGEVLTCDLYQAAVMTLPADEARRAMGRWETDPAGGLAWARELTGLPGPLAYLTPRGLFRRPGRVAYHGVGGVALDELAPDAKDSALAQLAQADSLAVRDRVTAGHLAAAGLTVRRLPDLAVLTARLLGDSVLRRGRRGEPARLAGRHPGGYLAAQFSADLGDDPGLERLAAQFKSVLAGSGLGLVLFRAGAAPWHDDLEVYRRLFRRLSPLPVDLFEGLDILDLCALLAGARAYVGTSLHGRIVAEAFGVPAVSLAPAEADRALKLAAWHGTWWRGVGPGVVGVEELAGTIGAALRGDEKAQRRRAGELADLALAGFPRALFDDD